MSTHVSTEQTWPQPVLALPNNFGYYDGEWRIDMHPRFLADVTGDKRPDSIGFGKEGVYVALNNGKGGFAEPRLVVGEFGYDQLWRTERHPRFVADLNGDGRADILGFADSGVYTCIMPPKEFFEITPS